MNKLILTKGTDITSASEQVVADIAQFVSCIDEDQIVIVPDRYSLITEKMIFEKLNITSTLNIKVMGINRFASFVLKSQNVFPKSMSNNSALVAIGKAVFEEKNNFKFFPKDSVDVSFLQQLKNTISQLKTSQIPPEKLENIQDDKLHDIYLVYKNYEQKQKNGVDLADFLEVFIQSIKNVDLNNTRVYFAFFDSMTTQGLEIVKMLLMKTKSVEFALAFPDVYQKNKFVYDTTLTKKLVAMASENGVEIEEKFVSSSNYISNMISKNIYLSNPQQIASSDFAKFWECSTNEAQYESVAREIKNHVVFGGRYSDCVLGVSDIEGNYKAIKRIFDDYEIPCFFDIDRTLSKTKIVEFLNLIFNYIQEKDTSILYDIFSNIFSNFSSEESGEICQLLDKYKKIDQDLELTELENQNDKKIYQKIIEFQDILTCQKTDKKGYISGKDFVEYINNIFQKLHIEETAKKLHDYYAELADLENQKTYEKIYEKIADILVVFEQETKDEKLQFCEFVVLLNNVFEGTKLSVVPLGVDQVFVGDVSKSFFESGKVFFLCGANQDKMPDFQKDVGLISDKDISRFSNRVKIDPTIRTINLRKRLKLCSVLSIPMQKLFVLWVAISDDGKKLAESTFVLGLKKMFGGEIQKIGFAGEIQSDDFAKDVSNIKRAKQRLISYLQNPILGSEMQYNTLFDILKKNDPEFCDKLKQFGAKNDVPNLVNNQLFFPQGKFSVSALEKYARCPFMFFLTYGLGIEEKSQIDLDEATIGRMFHGCLEKYFKANSRREVQEFVDEYFKQISKDEEFAIFFAYKKYASILNAIKRECIQTINDILEEQECSNYKIQYVEKHVGGNKVLFDFGNKKIAFGGIVDRIDMCGKKIVVIDYKTGKTEHEIQDVIYGNKIQIFVYLKALEETGDVEAVGALYYPISAKRKKKNEKKFLGFLIDEEAEKFDTTTKDGGKYLGVKLKNDGTIAQNKTIVTKQELCEFMDMAKSVMQQNLKNIADGYICPSPLKSGTVPCARCKFLGICKFDIDSGNKYRVMRKTSSNKQENE